ncbi:MAG TPA: MATE family efflux transporter [Bacillota bacterium]
MRDFTRGPILVPLLAFAGPTIAGNLLQISYNLVDTLWIGRLGGDALAAVSVSLLLFTLLFSFSWGLSSSGTAMVSQYFGAGQRQHLGRVSANLLLLFLVVSTAAAATMLLGRTTVLDWLATPPEIQADAALYLGINLLGLPAFYLFVVINALLRGVGDSVSPLKISVVGNVLNFILDPLLIFGLGPVPGLGVAGAAWATVLARALAVAWGLYLLQRPENPTRVGRGDLRIDPGLLITAVRVGVPAGAANLINSLGGVLLVRFVTPFGPDPVAAHGVGLRIESVAVLPAVAMGMASGAWAGQNIGAGQPDRAMRGSVAAMAVTFGGLVVIGRIAAWAAPGLVGVFAPGEPGVIAFGTRYLEILSLSWPFFGAVVVVSQTLRGAGDTLTNLALAAINLLLLRLPLAYLFSTAMGLGAVGVWWGMTASDLGMGVVAFIYLRSGRWLRHGLVRPAPGGG